MVFKSLILKEISYVQPLALGIEDPPLNSMRNCFFSFTLFSFLTHLRISCTVPNRKHLVLANRAIFRLITSCVLCKVKVLTLQALYTELFVDLYRPKQPVNSHSPQIAQSFARIPA